jgi:hypothetical protein
MTDDTEYYRQRALVERSRAKAAPSPEISLVHERLAELYEDYVASTEEKQAALSASAQPLLQVPRQVPSGKQPG